MQFNQNIPFQVLFDTNLLELKRWIASNNTNDASARNAITLFLHNFGVLTRETHAITASDPTFAPVLYYERVRVGLARIKTNTDDTVIGFSMECLPASLSLFGNVLGHAMHPNKCRDITLSDFINEQTKLVQKLECTSSDDNHRAFGVDTTQTFDLPDSLPRKVCVFVLAMRSVLNGMKRSKVASDFSQCSNKQCNRVFFSTSKRKLRECYDPSTTPVQLLDLPPCNPLMDSDTRSYEYWNTCGRVPFYPDALQRFCTSACCVQWRNRMDAALPKLMRFDCEENWSSCSAEKRVSLAFYAALERNSRFHQELVSLTRSSRRSKCISKRMLSNEVESRIDILNIDLGVLYWATIISRLPIQCKSNTILPGQVLNWRRAKQNVAVAQHVSALYVASRDHRSSPQLITTCLSTTRFFSTIKTHCNQVKRALDSSF